MRVERTVGRLRFCRRAAVDRQIVGRNDPGVLIYLTPLLVVVAGQSVPEFPNGSRRVDPALRGAVGAGRAGKVQVFLLRRSQGDEIHPTAERIAALRVGRPETFGDADAVKGRYGK